MYMLMLCQILKYHSFYLKIIVRHIYAPSYFIQDIYSRSVYL